MERDNELKILHKEEIRILEKVLEICKSNNIRFYMLGGTMLGAIRHKGFIPWDDDIDLGFPRKDYDKFIQLCKKEKNDIFDIITNEDEESEYNYVCKIQSKNVKITQKCCRETKTFGAWIDVFPMDGLPENKIILKIHKLRLRLHRGLWKLTDNGGNIGVDSTSRTKLENLVIKIGLKINIGKLFNKKNQLNKIDNLLRKYDFDKCSYNVNYFGAYKFRETFPKRIYQDITDYDFEGLKVPGPTDYDFYLTQLYGDYMTPPDKNNRNKHESKIETNN